MQVLERLAETLRGAGLEVDTGEMLEIRRPHGDSDDSVTVDPGLLREDLPADERAAIRHVAAFASGVRQALLEPEESDADHWDFTEAAGRLGMAVHARPFADGVDAVAGSPAWMYDNVEDLVYVVFIELDRGVRVLTRRQFDRWSATSDRVVSGARSMLFHEAQDVEPTEVEAHEPVERLALGDGYDAARALVLEDLLFGEFDDTSRVALPTTNDLYFVRDGGATSVEALRRATESRCDEVDYPLSRNVFRFDYGELESTG